MKKLIVIVLLFLFTSCASVDVSPSAFVLDIGVMLQESNNQYLKGVIELDEYARDMSMAQNHLAIDKLSPKHSDATMRFIKEVNTMKSVIADRKINKIDEDMFVVQVKASNANIQGILANEAVKAQLR